MTQPRAFDPELPFLAYPLAVDFANSTGPPARTAAADLAGGDLLRDAAGLRRWLATEAHAVSDIGLPAFDDVGDLERLRAFRTAITQLLRERARGQAPSTGAIAVVNAASAAAPTHPELVIGATGARLASHAPDWASELRGRIARSAIELLAGPDQERLGVCGAPACGMLFVASRRGQRWCSDSCGNRARVARHYHRGRQRVHSP